MPGVLVDSNVLLDVLTSDANWLAWSQEKLAECISSSSVYINPIVFAEVSVTFAKIEDLESVMPSADIQKLHIPYEAAFLAGKAFSRYRALGGTKQSPLPDFFIGAHAAVAGLTILTRDPKRYRTYFPTVQLISPP